MAKFHTTLSRRDFMKALGVGTAGIGTAVVAGPVFKDLEEMMSTGHDADTSVKRPWWVKYCDIGKPTTEIDWDAIKPHDNRYIMWTDMARNYLYGVDKKNQFNAEGAANNKAGAEAKAGGFLFQDFALFRGNNSATFQNDFTWNYTKGSPGVITYESQAGLNAWTGTPEENSKIVRAAAIYYGASSVGYCIIEDHEKNLFNSYHSEGRPFVWEDVDEAYDTPDKIVIPSGKQLYAIAIGIQFSKDIWKHEVGKYGSGQIRASANHDRYRRWQTLVRAIQKFIHFFGFNAMGYPGFMARSVLPSGSDAILSGLAESGRSNNVFISPEHGTCQGMFSIVTDMPLAPTKPIDAGIFRFCHTCHKCADSCPTGAIGQQKEPIWDISDPSLYQYGDGKEVKFNGNGKRVFTYDAGACCYAAMAYGGACSTCMGTCTFNTGIGAGIHDIIRPLVSTTSLFNGFLWRADGFYGFDMIPDEKKDEWWDKSLPINGIDSTVTAYDWAYRQRGQ